MIKERLSTNREDTPNEEIQAIFDSLKKEFRKNTTLDIKFRKTQLKNIKAGLVKHEAEIADALGKDLGANTFDAYLGANISWDAEIDIALKELDDWVKPRDKRTPVAMYPGKSYIKPQPKGVSLVISSWNYPFATMVPFISAIAAGNAVVMKPSEFAPETSIIMKKLCDEFLDQRLYRVIEGGVETGKKLTSLPFDVICFTGSTYVGKIIARAASANLTPCILELGGKCPTVVDHSSNLDLAAARIVSLKFINAGQTCIAPDFIFVHSKIKQKFIERVKAKIEEYYTNQPATCGNYSRLIHGVHAKRVAELLRGNESKVVHGDVNQIDTEARFITL